ncbi:hypothetical protein B0F90DRAFT_1774421 [Multifurca ochricompacta]|uniref:Uncharacterized protein n=1 Tax=Multifurca ochricompacta TaxID=376703 RepID=A0AAD4QJD9_9AGAM|nr:hypothetical protein B0F90DRAFT_1774421 [Multifurca ochricompacta]
MALTSPPLAPSAIGTLHLVPLLLTLSLLCHFLHLGLTGLYSPLITIAPCTFRNMGAEQTIARRLNFFASLMVFHGLSHVSL